MTASYLLLKALHVFIVVIAPGGSAGLGILMELFGGHPTHGPYVLRSILKIEWAVVVPGYVLAALTGLLTANGVWSVGTPWIAMAVAVWVIGLALLLGSLAALRLQIEALETQGRDSLRHRVCSLAARGLGAAAGLAIVAILYLMVTKPALAFLGWAGTAPSFH